MDKKTNLRNGTLVAVFLCLWLGLISCNPKFKEPEPYESFRNIYEQSDMVNYKGIDVQQTQDEGYIILGEVDRIPYLLRVDKAGKFQWEISYEKLMEYKDPVPNILVVSQENQENLFCFFCIKKIGGEWNTVLLKYHEKNRKIENAALKPEEIQLISPPPGSWQAIVPLQAALCSDWFLLLASEDSGAKIFLIQMDSSGNILAEKPHVSSNCLYFYPIYKDKRPHIIGKIDDPNYPNHFYYQTFENKNSTPSPVSNSLGETCFYAALVEAGAGGFVIKDEIHQDNPLVGLEWHTQEGVSKLSCVRIELGVAYYFINYPKDDLHVEGKAKRLAVEMNDSKPFFIESVTGKGKRVEGKRVVFFLATTRSDDVPLYGYLLEKQEYSGYKVFGGGGGNYEAAGLIETIDGGLAVLANTYVQDRMGRICLFKLSKEEVEGMIKD